MCAYGYERAITKTMNRGNKHHGNFAEISRGIRSLQILFATISEAGGHGLTTPRRKHGVQNSTRGRLPQCYYHVGDESGSIINNALTRTGNVKRACFRSSGTERDSRHERKRKLARRLARKITLNLRPGWLSDATSSTSMVVH